MAGMFKSRNKNIDKLFDKVLRRQICFNTMRLYRFKIITTVLRFNKKETRSFRRKNDKFAPIRDLFKEFAGQLPKHFIPYEV